MTHGDVASPRVSIITPFLNAGRFIQESIESVLVANVRPVGAAARRRRVHRRQHVHRDAVCDGAPGEDTLPRA